MDEDSERDVLHLFGVTADDPPVFYYRRVEDAHYGAASDERATYWGAWETPQHPGAGAQGLADDPPRPAVRLLDPLRHQAAEQGQEMARASSSAISIAPTWSSAGASSTEAGRPPQKLAARREPVRTRRFPESYQDDGVVLDPIVPKAVQSEEIPFWSSSPSTRTSSRSTTTRPTRSPRTTTRSRFPMGPAVPRTGEPAVSARRQLPDVVARRPLPAEDPTATFADAASEDEGVPVARPWLHLHLAGLSAAIPMLTSLAAAAPGLVPRRRRATRRTCTAHPSGLPCFDTYTYASLLIDEARFKQYETAARGRDPAGSPGLDQPAVGRGHHRLPVERSEGRTRSPTSLIDATLDVVNGSVGDVIIQTSKDAFYLQAEVRGDGKYHLRRLNTSVSADIADVLFNRGLESCSQRPRSLAWRSTRRR